MNLEFQSIDGIQEIARALNLGTHRDHEGRLLLQKMANNPAQVQPFESIKTMLMKERILFDILDCSIYEGATYIRIPLPIKTGDFYVSKIQSKAVEPVVNTWRRSQIVPVLTNLYYHCNGGLIFRGQEVKIGDLVIAKDWTRVDQILSFEKVKQTLVEWQVPFNFYDNAKEDNRCYIVIKKKYLVD